MLNEARRIKNKHILTTQKGIAKPQLNEMIESRVQLVVPAELHSQYPRDSEMEILRVERFVELVRDRLA